MRIGGRDGIISYMLCFSMRKIQKIRFMAVFLYDSMIEYSYNCGFIDFVWLVFDILIGD